jgi:hypothetical protein
MTGYGCQNPEKILYRKYLDKNRAILLTRAVARHIIVYAGDYL